MKIVLDTNCLLRILPNSSKYRCLWEAFLCNEFKLCYTNEILHEYEEVLSRFYFSEIAEYAVGTLLKSQNTVQITPYFKWNLISTDPDDNKFVDCALNAGADFIVTNDKHFNILKEIDFPLVKIIDIEGFYKMLYT